LLAPGVKKPNYGQLSSRGRKLNILNRKNDFLYSTDFKLFIQMKLNK